MKTSAVRGSWLGLALGATIVAAGCVGGVSTTIKGDIRDDAIAMPVDHAGSSVKLELRNVGTQPCDLIVGLTTLPADALPVVDGQVVITRDGSAGGVRPQDGGESPGSIAPGATASFELALEGTPKAEERVIFCNGVGEYELGRYASLRFDR